MTNSIVVKQNSPISLKRLEAQRVLYSSAKQFFAVQLILNVPVVIFISLLALALDKQWFNLPKYDMAWIVGATGGFFILLDIVVLNPLINKRRELAAKIQQCFDCEVLDLPWDEIKYGKTPDHEDLEIWSEKYKHDPARDLKDWYRIEVATLPHEVARMICQRANCWWDMDLRRKYNLAVYLLGAATVLTVLTVATGLNFTAETFLALILAPILPFLIVAIKLVQDNNDAITRLQAMKDGIDNTWPKILQGAISLDELTRFSNDLQGGVFNNRKSNPLVFYWVHKRAKPAHEKTTSKSTEQYVDEFKQAHPGGYLVL